MKLRVWTKAYRPWVMGGDVNAPIATEVEVGEPIQLEHGVTIYVVTSPTGKIFIAEGKTGAFVGGDIEEIKNDVANADPELLKQQFEMAQAMAKKADLLEPEDFWKCFK